MHLFINQACFHAWQAIPSAIWLCDYKCLALVPAGHKLSCYGAFRAKTVLLLCLQGEICLAMVPSGQTLSCYGACRGKAAARLPRHRASYTKAEAAVPELLYEQDSPVLARSAAHEACLQPSKPTGQDTREAVPCQDAPILQHELSLGPVRSPASAAGCCLRCGVLTGTGSAECSFHPALLLDPGPLRFSPEWHACKAAGHGHQEPGCYTRQGHYCPSQAVTGTGLVQPGLARGQVGRQEGQDSLPQPRTCLPVPCFKQHAKSPDH